MQGTKTTKKALVVVYSNEKRKHVEPAAAEKREASTGRVVRQIWAVAEASKGMTLVHERKLEVPKPELAFYRKYTEAMLRRYLRMAMESGRVPSLLGRELFRSRVTSYRVQSFEDVVIFCFDMERCLNKLDAEQQEVIKRVALQEYTHGEAAMMLGVSLRTLITKYGKALDRLTGLLLEARLLEPQSWA